MDFGTYIPCIIAVDATTIRHVKMHCRCGKIFVTEVPAELFGMTVLLPCDCGRNYKLRGNDLFTPEGKQMPPIQAVKMPTRTM